MAKLLYRLGKFSFRHRWWMVGLWVVLLGVVGAAALVFRVPVNDSFTIPGTEAQATVDMLEERFPEHSGGVATVVFTTPDDDSVTTDDYPDAIQDTTAEIEGLDGIESVTDPIALYEEGYQRALRSDQVRDPMVDAGMEQARQEYEEQREEGVASAVEEARQRAEAQIPADAPGRDAQLEQAEEQARTQAEAQAPAFPEDEARAQVESEVDQRIADDDLPADVRDEVRGEVLDRLPLISDDGTTALAQVQFTDPDTDISPHTVDTLLDSGGPAEDAGLSVNFSGQAITVAAVAGIQGGEGVGLAVALVVLIVNFGVLLAAGIPILSALVGTGVGIALVFALSRFVELSSTAPLLAVMLGLAVGIDYTLFVLARHRQQLLTGMDPEESTGRAIATAGSAVVFAGTTVVIALLGLTVAGIPFLSVMGVAAAITVAFSVLVATSFLPAVLGIVGRHFDALPVPWLSGRARRALDSDRSAGSRWARLVTRRPWIFVVLVLAVVAVTIVPVKDLRLGLPTDASSAPDSTQHRAYDLISEKFGAGYTTSLIVTVEYDDPAAPAEVREDIADMSGVEETQPPETNDANDTALIVVIPEHGAESVATEDLIHEIRDQRDAWERDTGATISVTGATATSIDTSERLAEVMPLYLAVVVGLAFLLLMVVFRSLLVPLKAALGFVLSMGSALGATVVVFQWGDGAGLLGVTPAETLLAFLPIVLIGTLFGLAMDYEVFLVSRMREDYVHGGSAPHAIVSGFRSGARVVTAAALIMTSVFASFVFSDNTTIQPVAFALAVGVLVDAFLIRMTLVPALMRLFGTAAWWLPSWLDRILPNVDIEGARLHPDRQDGPG
ncbi:MMPL family transporter [Spiractinospora alimapuensis]|uniref:MMPL family transporter n=1 Tax=Spiractinospora alimapuensis TaxID=2820884 RepID=UPI0022AB4C29|nr:MMPL family transporter [Spiractinospora alimapuensis]QVQ53478.1 MMPL family transporter [Spiractinospora alimapuensis]